MYKHFFKRLFDFCIALVALLLIGWLLIIIAIWLHYANKGNANLNVNLDLNGGKNLNWWQRWLRPVIFTQERASISGWAQCHGRNAISWTEKF